MAVLVLRAYYDGVERAGRPTRAARHRHLHDVGQVRQLRHLSDGGRLSQEAGDRNVYTYECENDVCDPNVTRTVIEVPRHLDNSTRRAEELPYYEKDRAEE